jgi:hypothetical protein
MHLGGFRKAHGLAPQPHDPGPQRQMFVLGVLRSALARMMDVRR